MTGLWLVSYLIMWLLVVIGGLLVLALAREVEALHKRLESLEQFLRGTDLGMDNEGQ